jgi:predicted TPR repeat methyltransferase
MDSSFTSSDASTANQPDWLRPNAIPKSAEDAQQEYDQISHTYDNFVQSASYQSPKAVAELLEKFVLRDDNNCLQNGAILDAGCGTGLLGLELARHGFSNIMGFDVSQNMLKEAEAKAVYANLVRADLLGSLPWTEQYFSAIVCIGVFSRFSEEQILEILTEFSRVVQKGGLIIFSHREDLMKESKLMDLITQNTRFQVELITEPLPYLPGAVGYEEIGVQYVVLKNVVNQPIS